MTLNEERTDTIRVLHVDDQLEFAEMATTFLEQENKQFDTETAASVADGLTHLADSSFDCVVSDYDMPTQDGIEFLRTVRQKDPMLPFILYTGKGSEEVASEAISAGVTDYLQKSSGTEQYKLLADRITNAVDQSQTEQRVHAEQQRFHTLFDCLSQPTVEVRYEAGEPIIRQVNPAFEDVFGYAPDTVVGDSLDAHIVSDDRTHEAAAFSQHDQAGGRPESRAVTRQTTDGPREFLLQNAVYGDGSGGFAMYTDITDRSQRKETLERTRELLRHTEQLAEVGGWEADIETDEMRWTQGTYAIHDIDPDGGFEPSIETGIEFYHPDDQAAVETAVDKCRTHGIAYEIESRLMTAEDEQKWVCITGEPIYDGDDIVKIRGAICDITEIQTRRQELLALNQQYQTLVKNFPNGAVYLIDEDLEYVRAGGEELEQADMSPADFEGHTPHDVFPAELADEACQQYKQAFNGTATAAIQEYRGERYQARVTPVRTDGDEITHVMAVAQNITEYVEDKRELQRQNAQLDEFASVVSHDLRNPLSVAEGNLEFLREECDSERINDIDSALTRIDDLIEDLLQLARTGKQLKSPGPVNLAELSQDCWQNVETPNATIYLNIDGTARADRSRLAQVFENLMRNAIEHTDQDEGKNEGVTITVGELHNGFFIEDDGNGIPVDERDDVFETGYTTSKQGTGFGLPIVRRIIEAHGWEISLTGGSEGGARFEVTGIESNRGE